MRLRDMVLRRRKPTEEELLAADTVRRLRAAVHAVRRGNKPKSYILEGPQKPFRYIRVLDGQGRPLHEFDYGAVITLLEGETLTIEGSVFDLMHFELELGETASDRALYR